MEILAKQRLNAMAILLEDLSDNDIKRWAKDINSDKQVAFLIKNKQLATTINNLPIYKVIGDRRTFYFAQNPGIMGPEYPIVFYAEVVKSTFRNDMFRTGMHQSLIWKAPGFMYGANLSIKFLLFLLKTSKQLLMTDMKQTVYGRNMWIGLLHTVFKTYDCYYALSAPSDAKCIIKIEKEIDIAHYEKDIVQKDYPYAYRTAFILQKGTDPTTILKDPKHTLILTCKEAEELDAFTTPTNLTKLQEDKMFDEYSKV